VLCSAGTLVKLCAEYFGEQISTSNHKTREKGRKKKGLKKSEKAKGVYTTQNSKPDSRSRQTYPKLEWLGGGGEKGSWKSRKGKKNRQRKKTV